MAVGWRSDPDFYSALCLRHSAKINMGDEQPIRLTSHETVLASISKRSSGSQSIQNGSPNGVCKMAFGFADQHRAIMKTCTFHPDPGLHALRHTFLTEAGRHTQVRALQKLAGHSKIETRCAMCILTQRMFWRLRGRCSMLGPKFPQQFSLQWLSRKQQKCVRCRI